VEEIMPVFTHVLVLKAGRVFAAGPKREVLTPQRLRDAFGAAVRLHVDDGRYSLTVEPKPDVVI
jgi:iron complex transport system ATP-binding protein